MSLLLSNLSSHSSGNSRDLCRVFLDFCYSISIFAFNQFYYRPNLSWHSGFFFLEFRFCLQSVAPFLIVLMNDICTISFFLWDWVNRCFWPFSSVSRSFPTELGSSGPKFKMILELQFLHLLIKSSLCCYSSVIYFTSEDLKFKTAFGLKQISVKIVCSWMSVKHSFPMLSLIPFLWYHLSLS